MYKGILVCVTALSCLVGLQGCNSSEVAFGAGVVGGALIANSYNHNHPHYRYRQCYNRYDGYYYCRYGSTWYRANRWSNDNSSYMMAAQGRMTKEEAVAQKYGLSVRSASTLIQVFDKTRTDGRLEHLQDIGLTSTDLERMDSGRMPQDLSLHAMGVALGASDKSIRLVISDVIREYSLQKQFNWKL